MRNNQKLIWSTHNNKHILDPKAKWDKKTIKSTKVQPALYKPGTNIELIERMVWEKGITVKKANNQIWKVMELDVVVGAHLGKETKYVIVKMSANTIHGHPINADEARSYLKKAKQT